MERQSLARRKGKAGSRIDSRAEGGKLGRRETYKLTDED